MARGEFSLEMFFTKEGCMSLRRVCLAILLIVLFQFAYMMIEIALDVPETRFTGFIFGCASTAWVVVLVSKIKKG